VTVLVSAEKYMKRILIVLMIVAAPYTGVCSGFSKVGTAAAQFLKIGVGARAAGMGETYAAIADGASTLYWNPAGIINVQSTTAGFSHSKWLGEISHDYFGLVVPLGDNDGFGLSAIMLNTNEQEVTTVDQPEGTGVFYNVRDLAIGLSYARALTDRFSVGLTAKYIQQDAYNESANSLAIDLGTYLQTGFHNLVIGMCVSNFGGTMQLEGRDLIILADINKNVGGEYNPDARLKTEPWPLPLNFRIGLAMDILGGPQALVPVEQNRVTVAIDWNHPNDNLERMNFGCEYGWNETFYARMGYKLNYDVSSLTFGAGVRIAIENQQVDFDYALVDYKDLGKVSRLSLELKF
jgi:hypothetical protein